MLSCNEAIQCFGLYTHTKTVHLTMSVYENSFLFSVSFCTIFFFILFFAILSWKATIAVASCLGLNSKEYTHILLGEKKMWRSEERNTRNGHKIVNETMFHVFYSFSFPFFVEILDFSVGVFYAPRFSLFRWEYKMKGKKKNIKIKLQTISFALKRFFRFSFLLLSRCFFFFIFATFSIH